MRKVWFVVYDHLMLPKNFSKILEDADAQAPDGALTLTLPYRSYFALSPSGEVNLFLDTERKIPASLARAYQLPVTDFEKIIRYLATDPDLELPNLASSRAGQVLPLPVGKNDALFVVDWVDTTPLIALTSSSGLGGSRAAVPSADLIDALVSALCDVHRMSPSEAQEYVLNLPGAVPEALGDTGVASPTRWSWF